MPEERSCTRALIVDDNQDAAESFARVLQAMGCDATFGTDPYIAIETAGRIRAERVFLALGMPGIDGYELARSLQANTAGKASRSSRSPATDPRTIVPELVESMLKTLFSR
jgi:CheY-like chemotaxis protein